MWVTHRPSALMTDIQSSAPAVIAQAGSKDLPHKHAGKVENADEGIAPQWL